MNRTPQVLPHRLTTAAALILVMALLSFLVPTSDALWFKVLGISGRITTREAEGCTPGFWKQEHHFDSWPEPYAPDTAFESVFGRDIPEDPTLHQGLELHGGGLSALMRHTVAALLNAAHSEVDYAFSVDQVIAKFQAAFDSGVFEPTKDEFEAANEASCPLNGGENANGDPVEEAELTTDTPTPSSTATSEDEATSTPTYTSSPTATGTPTAEPSSTSSPNATNTPSPETSPTATQSGTPSPTPNDDPSPSATAQATATPSPEPGPTLTPFPTETEDASTPEG